MIVKSAKVFAPPPFFLVAVLSSWWVRRGEERTGDEGRGGEEREQNRTETAKLSVHAFRTRRGEGGLTIWCVKAAVGWAVGAAVIATSTDDGEEPRDRRENQRPLWTV